MTMKSLTQAARMICLVTARELDIAERGQTKEERQTTVYAVELSVENQDGKLKPGMPVDVAFEE